MKWNLILSGGNTGKYNMDFDVKLAKDCRADTAYFRLYTWEPYAISLGANQSFEDIDLEKTEQDRIDVVKRPTGGRAILHAEEITYSVVIPTISGYSARELYQHISIALVKGLNYYDSGLSGVELETLQPDFAELYKKPSGSLCFASTAKSEVKYFGKKVIGSAQRKLNKAILQHGSILAGKFHTKLPEYLNTNEKEIYDLDKELREKTIEIGTILDKEVDYQRLQESLIEGFQDAMNVKFESKEELE
jgi:lipoate-protein ligase A